MTTTATPYPFHAEASGHVDAPQERVFEHVDDPLRLSSHMQSRSMAMMGTSMRMGADARGGRAVGSTIWMDGHILGVRLALEEVVVEREPPRFKAWEIVGTPRLLVIGPYRMGLRLAQEGTGARLTVFIDYAHPPGVTGRLLGRLLGASYARWCCRQMLHDAQQAFAPGGSTAARAQP